jgi:Ca2+-binding EF-hand superfamily protein
MDEAMDETQLNQEEVEDAIADTMAKAEEAFDEGDVDWSGELEFHEFISAFKSDARFVKKVSEASKISMEDITCMTDLDLEMLFDGLDTDLSGTISFDEFVNGLISIRLARETEIKQEEVEQMEEVLDEAYMDAADAFDDASFGEHGDLGLDDFIMAMKDAHVVGKVAHATHIPEHFLLGMERGQLEQLFVQVDTDMSGTVSFTEWVNFMVKVRKDIYKEEKAEEKMVLAEMEAEAAEEEEKEAALDDAYMEAADAFDDADFGYEGELSLDQFMEAMKDPSVIEKISHATKISPEDLYNQTEESLMDFFRAIDTDFSGTVSFNEWVNALVKIRSDKFDQEKIEEKEMEAEVQEAVAWAEAAFDEGDEDWSNELEFDEFLRIFKTNEHFVTKVAIAANVPLEEIQSMDVQDLAELFQKLDKDYSGTISFDEFVDGIIQIRLSRREEIKEEQAEIEAEIEAEVQEAVALAEDLQIDEDFSHELDFDEFLRIFKENENFGKKVAIAANVPLDEILAMTDDDLAGFFQALDKDYSGTISFDEFVEGLIQIRVSRLEEIKEEQAEIAAEEQAEMEETAMQAMDAIQDVEFDPYEGLSRENFHKAVKDPKVVERLSQATHVPEDYFLDLTFLDLEELFDYIDTNGNGSIDFDEWTTAMMNIRQQTFEMEKMEEEDIIREVKLRSTQVFKEIFVGELAKDKFVENFKSNEPFIRSVATTLNIPKSEISTLGEDDLVEFFKVIDVDASGSVSYHEFVDAVVKFRINQKIEQRKADLKSKGKMMQLKWDEPEGLKPLPESEEIRLGEKYLELSPLDDLDVAHLPDLLREMGLLIDDETVNGYLLACFAGKDFSGGLKLKACTIVYKYALTKQPLRVLPLQRSASDTRLTAADARSQESTLRGLFSSRAAPNAGGQHSVGFDDIDKLLKDIGLIEGATFQPPEFLDTYKRQRKKTGAVDFSETVQLCNAAVEEQRKKALGLGLQRSSSATELPKLKPSRPKRLDWTSRGKAVLARR